MSEQPSGCKGTKNSRTGRPVDAPPSSQSCVPVSVELVDKDEDAHDNVDADQTRTGRPVSGQPTGSFTQLDEIDIDFRVPGLSHAVVKQAEKIPRSRAREEDRKSSSSRSTSSRLAAE